MHLHFRSSYPPQSPCFLCGKNYPAIIHTPWFYILKNEHSQSRFLPRYELEDDVYLPLEQF